MALRSRFYLHLAVALNCLILAFLILDSRSINSLDIDIGLFPERWDQDGRGWIKSSIGETKDREGRCGMCRGNTTLCDELGYVLHLPFPIMYLGLAADPVRVGRGNWTRLSGMQVQVNV